MRCEEATGFVFSVETLFVEKLFCQFENTLALLELDEKLLPVAFQFIVMPNFRRN